MINKVYSKSDYIEYKKNLPAGTIKDKILSLCFENFQDSDNKIRTDVLSLLLGYKMALTNQEEGTLTPDYEACSEILGSNFKSLTYSKIAGAFGYSLIDNPRTSKTRESLAFFDLDIAHGNLNPGEEYTGEYFSYVYCLDRRGLILESVLWGQNWSKEIKDTCECIKKREVVFRNFYKNNPSLVLPVFIENIVSSLEDSTKNSSLLWFCYGDDTYGEWKYTWSKYTGRGWYDWTREDEVLLENYSEAIDQYLSLHKNMTSTMERTELLYYAELSIILGVSAIWKFENGDLPGDQRDDILRTMIERLRSVGEQESMSGEGYSEMVEELQGLIGMYYDQERILEVLGWKIFI